MYYPVLSRTNFFTIYYQTKTSKIIPYLKTFKHQHVFFLRPDVCKILIETVFLPRIPCPLQLRHFTNDNGVSSGLSPYDVHPVKAIKTVNRQIISPLTNEDLNKLKNYKKGMFIFSLNMGMSERSERILYENAFYRNNP